MLDIDGIPYVRLNFYYGWKPLKGEKQFLIFKFGQEVIYHCLNSNTHGFFNTNIE